MSGVRGEKLGPSGYESGREQRELEGDLDVDEEATRKGIR